MTGVQTCALPISLGVIRKKPNSKSGRFTTIFSSKNFIILALTCRFLTHFELIFAYDVSYGPKFFLLYMEKKNHLLSQDHLLKRLFHFPFNCLGTLVKKKIEQRGCGEKGTLLHC